MAMLDLPADETDGSYRWQRVTPADPDHMPLVQRLMHVLADRAAWQAALTAARHQSGGANEFPAVDGRAA